MANPTMTVAMRQRRKRIGLIVGHIVTRLTFDPCAGMRWYLRLSPWEWRVGSKPWEPFRFDYTCEPDGDV